MAPAHKTRAAVRLSDGGGLHVSITKQGNAYFQFRKTLAGHTATTELGKYPKMTLAEARNKAGELRADIERERDRRREKSNREVIKQLKRSAKQAACPLDSLDLLRRFISELFKAFALSPDHAMVIVLSLLVPAHPKVVVDHRRNFVPNTLRWPIVRETGSPGARKLEVQKEAYLSDSVGQLFSAWIKKSRAKGEFEPWEPGRGPRILDVRESLAKIWPRDKVSLEDLRTCFKSMALKHSLFSPMLIEDAMNWRYGRDPEDYPEYETQRWALANWWAKVLKVDAGSQEFQQVLASFRTDQFGDSPI